MKLRTERITVNTTKDLFAQLEAARDKIRASDGWDLTISAVAERCIKLGISQIMGDKSGISSRK